MVLVGSDRSEASLLKHKGFKVLLSIFFTVFAWVHIDNMKAGLVSVHGVENNLEDKVAGLELGNGRKFIGHELPREPGQNSELPR